MPAEGGAPVDPDAIPLEDEGLVGQVTDGSGRGVPGGRVVLIPAQDVSELAETPVDLSKAPEVAAASTVDEPIEDLLDAANDYPSAPVDDGGVYRLQELPEGDYFVVFTPAADDPAHAPGGDASWAARSSTSLRGTRRDLRVSGLPSADAHYVGSTPCLSCHGRHTSLGSAHALSLRAPGLSTELQDAGAAPQVNQALPLFVAGTTLYYTDCDTSRVDMPVCVVSTTAPGNLGDLELSVTLMASEQSQTGGVREVRVRLESGDGLETADYTVDLTLGGALTYQQYLTRLRTPDGGFAYYALPFSYQRFGKSNAAEFRDRPWVAYAPSQWVDLSTGSLREPGTADAFDRQCASCHVTGAEVRGSERDGFHVAMASDPGGLDYDADGQRDLAAVGCEACHGPGSEHLEANVRGAAIVSPRYLTPGRSALVCGRCHSNPLGVDGSLAPLSADGHFPRPGMRRSEYLVGHTSRIDGAATDFFPSGDSSHARQQYSDYLRSPKYRGGVRMLACGDCHDSHRSEGYASDLQLPADDNGACTSCHAESALGEVRTHVAEQTDYTHDELADSELACTTCHMVDTARGGAAIFALTDQAPPGAAPVQYYHGDRASHRFVFVGRGAASEQPVAATDRCGFCHVAFLPNP